MPFHISENINKTIEILFLIVYNIIKDEIYRSKDGRNIYTQSYTGRFNAVL